MAQQQGRSLTAICSARSPELAMSVDLFRSYGAEVIVVHDEDGSSEVPALEALIEARIAAGSVDAFYTCGDRSFQLQVLKQPPHICIEVLRWAFRLLAFHFAF